MKPATSIDCLFIHGWGMNHEVWQGVVESLPDWIIPHLFDLPGHGLRSGERFNRLDDLSADIASYCQNIKKQRPLMVVAWSLGALPVLQLMAKARCFIDGAMVVSSTPCFVKHEHWDKGIDAVVFDEFAASLKQDFSATIRRFLSLQVAGSDSGRIVLRQLRERILQQPIPDAESLEAGLQILKQTNLCDQLINIKQPVSWALGQNDGLIKCSIAGFLSQQLPDAEVEVYEKAGHAPFLSHADKFTQQLLGFASQLCV